MLPRRVLGVVFDMDGLLIDSEVVYREAMMHVAKTQGHYLPSSVHLRMVGLPGPAWQAVAMEHFGENFPIDAYNEAVWAHARSQHEAGVPLKPGALELLDYLESVGLPKAIATSSSHAAVKLQLSPSGVLSRFQTVIAAGDYARGKPNPDPFLKAAERLGLDPVDCLALEDSHNGVRAAHAAGMMTVMVPDLLEATDEMRTLSVAVADDLHEVKVLLAKSSILSASRAPAG
jgi:HAD superfamily hydrolase (TIGR01509 family)